MTHRRTVALLLVYVFGLESSALATLRATRVTYAASAQAAPVTGPAPRPIPVPEAGLPAAAERRLEPPNASATGQRSRPSTTPLPGGAPPPAQRKPRSGSPAPAPGRRAAPGFDLNLWSRQGHEDQGAWHVAPDGASVVQYRSGGPTFLVSPDDHVNTTIRGLVRASAGVLGAGAFGIAFGYRAPLLVEGHDPSELDLLLLEWRGGDDPFPGFTVSRVLGAVAPGPASLRDPTSPVVEVLAQRLGPEHAWAAETDYALEIVYRRGRLQVRVDGSPVIDVRGEFPAGRLGFYTNGQSGVRFAAFSAEPGNTAPSARASVVEIGSFDASCEAQLSLDGSGSSDPDGDALRFQWTGAFGSAEAARPVVTLPIGHHTIRLTVDDGNGESARTEIEVAVNPPSEPGPCAPTAVDSTAPAPPASLSEGGRSVPASLDLGAARRFAGFFREGFAATASAVGGRLAAGGDVWLDHCSIASQLTEDATGPSLVVGGDLVFPEGRVHSGDVVVAGSAAGVGQPVLAGLGPDQTLTELAELPFDFGREWQRLERTSANLAAQSPNGAAELRWGGLYLQGDCQSALQVFSLSGAEVLAAQTFEVECLPDGATVVFNVSDAEAGLTDLSLAALAGHQSTTLFNFYEADTLTLSGVGVRGSLLAPYADVANPTGQVHGSVMARSWSGGAMEIHSVPFKGIAPDDVCPLYPLALPYDLVGQAPPGSVFHEVPRGTGPGHFSWLTWTGAPDAPTLATSLVPPGDSHTYVNPDDDTDWMLSPGDWVQGAPGSMNSSAVRGALDALLGEPIAVPAWSATRGQGNELDYLDEDFVSVRLLDYELKGKGWLSFELLGPFACAVNTPPVVDAGPDLALQLPDAVAALSGTVTDDGLPGGGDLSVLWTVVEGPGPVAFADPTSPSTTASFVEDGDYLIRLSASDTELSASDEAWVVVVQAVNTAPLVDAGPDLLTTLPADTVVLAGSVSDDGLPEGGELTSAWTQLSGPPGVGFLTPDAPLTSAVFPAAGTYALQLQASDGELSAADTVTVVVEPQPPPQLSIDDLELTEGSGGERQARLTARLSRAPDQPVTANWGTFAGTATEGCDYWPRYDSLTFGVGETEREIAVPIVPDLAIEPGESFTVRLGDVTGADLARAEAEVSILDDDLANRRPQAIADRSPANGVGGVPRSARLSWSGADPDPGDTLAFDVRLGAGFGTDGQSWSRSCPAGAAPGARAGAASAFDASGDRLLIFGGRTASGAEPSDVWILESATGAGAPEMWRQVAVSGAAPVGRVLATAAYDPLEDRLIVHGGCQADCTTALADTWVLTGATGPAPEWVALPPAPLPRYGHVAALDPAANRLVVFGGSDGVGLRADVWVLSGANGLGSPVWEASNAPGPPAERREAAAGYDPAAGQLLLFGGEGVTGPLHDVWLLKNATAASGLPAWHRIDAEGVPPSARSGHVAAFDAHSRRLLVFGGRTTGPGVPGGLALRDAWLLVDAVGASGPPRWVEITPAGGDRPPARAGMAAGYSPSDNRLSVWGGASDPAGGEVLDDTWVMRGATGELPLVAVDLAAPDYPAELPAEPATWFWRVIARDQNGAETGSLPLRFSTGLPRVTVADVAVPEGDTDETPVTLTLSLSVPSHAPVEVDVATADGLATAGADYVATADTVVIPAGVTEATLSIPILGDTQFEADEDVVVALGPVAGAELDVTRAQVLLLDDDPQGNSAPLVDAGSDASIDVRELSLRAIVSDDGLPEAGSLVTAWTLVSGPGIVLFADPNDPLTTATFASPGHYVLRLTADDGELSSSDDLSVTVTLVNQPPQVDAGPDRAASVGAEVVLAGTASDDGLPAGGVLSVAWSVLSGPGGAPLRGADGLEAAVTFDAPGTYVLALSASDGELSDIDQMSVVVAPVNAPPVVDAGADQQLELMVGGRIVVSSDEWTLSNTGFSRAPEGAARFALNVADWFAPGGSGSFLVYTDNFGLTQSQLASTMAAAGHTWVVDTQLPFTLDTLLQYDAVFLADENPGTDVLIDYLRSGGNVYVAGGTGIGGAAAEAARWNPFLIGFGLELEPIYSFLGTLPIQSSHVLFAGVSELYFGNGNPVIDLDPADPLVEVVQASNGRNPFGMVDAVPLALIRLAGSVSDDGLPPTGSLSIAWTQLAGPVPVDFGDPGSPETTVRVEEPGTYVFQLAASDAELASSDTVSVEVDEAGAVHSPVIVSRPLETFALPALPPAPPELVDLSNWRVIQYDLGDEPGATWRVEASGTEAVQDIDADASILLSDFGLTSDRIEGRLRVDSAADDDHIGLLFAYQDEQHFYLFDWKRLTQSDDRGTALQGMTIKVVDADRPLTGADLWPSAGDGQRVRPLYSNDVPWQPFVDYGLSLEYRSGQFTLTVRQGDDVLESVTVRDPTYATGRFGFYTYSQGAVRYSDFTRETLPAGSYVYDVRAVDLDDDPLSFELTAGPTGMAIDPMNGQVEWPVSPSDVGPHTVAVRVEDSTGRFDEQPWTLTVLPPNEAPGVDAGEDQTVVLPERTVLLDGSTSDDGIPSGAAPETSWSQVSGPGSVTFSDPAALDTAASFDEVGVYALRLSAFDGDRTGSDEVTVTLLPSGGPNVAPTVSAAAGADSLEIEPNLLSNPDAEGAAGPGAPAGWVPAVGSWSAVAGGYTGQFGFAAPGAGVAELRQDVDLTSYGGAVARGELALSLELRVRAGDPAFSDVARVVVEYRDHANVDVLGRLDTGLFATPGDWVRIADTRPVPGATGFVRLRLVSQASGATSGAVFDALALRPVSAAAVDLAGTVEDDGLPLGSPVSAAWSLVSGPGPVVFGDATAPSTTATFQAPGIYSLRLTADDSALQASTDLEVAVAPPNEAPRVDAGIDLVLRPDEPASLSALVGDDGLPAGSSVAVRWSLASGPRAVSFDDPERAQTQATFPEPGAYRLRIVASDGERHAEDVLAVTVLDLSANHPPEVEAGPARSIQLPARTVALQGEVADDGLPEGGMPSVVWALVGGPGTVTFSDPTAPSTSATFSEPGPYLLRLTASDSELESFDETVVSVLDAGAANTPPFVTAGPDRILSLPLTTLTLAGQVVDDGRPAGETVSVAWSQRGGPGAVGFAAPQQPSTGATFTQAGEYLLRLTASDGEHEVFDEILVLVTEANRAPQVDAGPPQSLGFPAQSTTALTGSVEDDGLPVGTSVSTLWSQVGGPAAVIVAPTATSTLVRFPGPGQYVFRLAASDSALVGADDVTVEVLAGNQPPTVEVGPDQTLVLPDDSLDLLGLVSDDGLPEGLELEYGWTLVSGPASVSFTTPAAPSTGASFLAAGSYTLRLTASDGQLSGFDELLVTVSPVPPAGEAPAVSLLSPGHGAPVSEPVPVVGTVVSESLVAWRLERRLAGAGDDAWSLVASGTEPVDAGILGTLDPTLALNGLSELRLSAADTAGREARDSIRVVVRDNQKIGHFTVSFVDLEVPVAGLPIRVTRTYDSRDKGRGDFGHGWRLDLGNVRLGEAATLSGAWLASTTTGAFPSYCLQLSRPAVVTVTMPGGDTLEFDPVLSRSCSTFVPLSEVRIGFVPRSGTVGRLEILDGDHAFVSTSWPSGGGSVPALLLSASTFGPLDPERYRLTLPDGRSFVIRQGQGLETLTDLNGNRLTVSADGVRYQNPAVAESFRGIDFVRDPQGRIESISDPMGNVVRYEYDAAGDLVSHTDRELNATRFVYAPAFPHHLKSIVDPLGRTPIRNEYYDDGRLKSHTDAFDRTIVYTHGVGVRQETIEDRLGGLRVLDYDERGNVIRETQPDGRVIVRTFDGRNNRLSETEPHEAGTVDPPTTTWTYDANDNLLSTTDPLGSTTSQTYDAHQRVLTSTDARQKTTTNAYDARGNLLSTTDPELGQTRFTYDAAGNVITQTDAAEGVTAFSYDAVGDLILEVDAAGVETRHRYDRNGNRTSTTTTRTGPRGAETLTTRFLYDDNGRLLQTIEPDGSRTSTEYDALGKQVRSVDGLGRETAFEYDAMGRLVKTIFPDLTTEESEYDAEGRRTASIDRAGRRTEYEYDAQSRLVKTTFPDTSVTESFYDEAGRLEAARDARGNVTRFEYDAAGRRTRVIDALLQAVKFGYDANGNQTSVTDARNRTTRFEYDDLNRRTKTIFPDQTFSEATYDALGRRIAERDQAGKVTRFEYDGLGRLIRVIDALQQETTYGYDEQGNRVRQTDANGHTTYFEYDELGRQTKRILPGGAVEAMVYDEVGNLSMRTDFNGVVTEYSYDASNRLVGRSYPDPGKNVSFTYTPMGNRETATDSRGTTVYTYDNRNRLETVTYPDGRTLTYGYDANGNRTSLTAEVGGQTLTTTYSYDELNRLQTVTDSEGRDYVHEYDPNGNRQKLTYPNNTETSYVYDDLNRLTNLTTINTATLGMIQSYQYTLGPAGNRERIDEHDETARVYTYDDLYRLEKETVGDSVGLVYEKSFVYDPVGNRQSQTTAGTGAPGTPLAPGTIDYTYDDRDRILTEGTQPYSWDENGNLVTKDAEASYTWDLENRLTRVNKADGTVVTHAYDADGNRVRTEVTPSTGPPEVTELLVDPSGSLSHVVAESTGSGTLIAQYVRGDDLLSVIRPSDARYFHADGLGSIRRLTSEIGTITDGYTYTAFGERLAHTGNDPQPYAFTGEPLDLNVGWQYHRARWMDPDVATFASIDPFEGKPSDPPSLHKYLYVSADPVNKTDPTGRFTLTQQITVGAMLGAVANVAIVQPRGVRHTVETALLGAAAGAAGVATGSAFVALYLRLSVTAGVILTAGGITVLPKGLQHVVDRHTWGGVQSAGRSVFWAGTNLLELLRRGASTPAVQQANGNFARFVYAGYQVGIDRFTSAPTSIYTIITSPTGQLVTMFPGVP